jgi:hypothetical protein
MRYAGCFIQPVKAAGMNVRTSRERSGTTRAPTVQSTEEINRRRRARPNVSTAHSRKRLSGDQADRVIFSDGYCERGRSYPEALRLKMKNRCIPPESRIVSDQRFSPEKITLSPDVWGLVALHYLRFDPKRTKSFFPLSPRADFRSGCGLSGVTWRAGLRSALSDIESAARAQIGAFSGDCGHTMPFFAC